MVLIQKNGLGIKYYNNGKIGYSGLFKYGQYYKGYVFDHNGITRYIGNF